MLKEIYTGFYLFSAVNTDTSFWGISGRITIPDYTKKLILYLSEKYMDPLVQSSRGFYYNFTLDELEGLYSSLEKIINDIRKLESLSKQGLLKDVAYVQLDKEE